MVPSGRLRPGGTLPPLSGTSQPPKPALRGQHDRMNSKRLDQLAADREPWQQQPGESAKLYKQFCAYRDSGLRRSLTQTAETLTLSYGHTRNTASLWKWAERSAAWDKDADALYRAEFAEERRKAARHDARVLNQMMVKAGQALEALDALLLSPTEIIRLADVAMRHRRALFGDPTSVVAVTGPSGDPLSVEITDFAQLPEQARATRLQELAETAIRRAAALADAA